MCKLVYRSIALFLLLSLGLAGSANAQLMRADDPMFGTWELDVAASVFIDRSPPRREVRVYTPHELGMQARIITVDQKGVRSELGYTGSLNGAAYRAYGVQGAEEVTLQRIDPFTSEAIYQHAGQEIGKTVQVLSREGNQMTVELSFGGNLVSRAVYRKQDAASNVVIP